MMQLISNRLYDDFFDLQIEGFSSQLNAINQLVNLQSNYIKQNLISASVNSDYAESFRIERYEQAAKKLKTLKTELKVLDSVLLVDLEGRIVSSADQNNTGIKITETAIWSKIINGDVYPVDFILNSF